MEFKVIVNIADSRHLLQKYAINCDSCHNHKDWIFLRGGGLRECLDCKCLQLEIVGEIE